MFGHYILGNNMEAESRIIAIRKQNISLAHKAFAELMGKTEHILNDNAKNDPAFYRSLSASDLEVSSLLTIKEACQNTPFNSDEVKLISGQRFPDIIADKYYGIEVKSTKSDSWTSTGSSIVESTRDSNVESLYMLFGKLGGAVPEFMCRPYEDVLYDIAVTHSPRYLINMEIERKETIFSKMGTTYDDFRKADDSIAKVRKYYRDKALQERKIEMPWWITSDNADKAQSFNIKLWNSLNASEKRELQIKCMILFPEALNPASSKTKYNNTSLWLCSYNQVVNPNIRDMYSAGGSITHVNGKKLCKPVAQVYNRIVDCAEEIKALLTHPTSEMMALIRDFHPTLLLHINMFEAWVSLCEEYAQKDNVPLRLWIKTKPKFQFSK